MYQLEKNTRIYMKDDADKSGGGGPPRSALANSRSASRSPLQELSKTGSHHKSNQAIYTNGKDCNGSPTHHPQTKTLKNQQQRAISSEMGSLTAFGETKTKTQIAREMQETQELRKTADSKAGLQTVVTKRLLKKTTTLTKGENEKVRVVSVVVQV